SEGKKISDNSCGGQPSFVSTFKLNSETIFLFGSDLWNNAAKNEALANFYWAPLTFAADGSINPLVCGETAAFPKAAGNTITNEDFTTVCDINKTKQRGQLFTANKSGMLHQLDFTTFKSGYPDADLIIELYNTDDQLNPTGPALASAKLQQDKLSWSPKNYAIKFNASVIKGKSYTVVIKSANTSGNYGFEYNEPAIADGNASLISNDGNGQFVQEKGKAIKLKVYIK
ncbi:MAG: hypothetical protein AAGC65_16260, partial [Mucilaginibacter sp.]